MNSVVSPSYSTGHASHGRDPTPDPEMSRVISSTWHVLEQMPPPSLREVLGAYNLKGDGDRDMLIAMLNAKSAEDQRMASVAALHRTLLELHHTPPPLSHISLPPFHAQPTPHSYPPRSISRSPPTPEMKPTNLVNPKKRPTPPPAREARTHNTSSPKRQRTSRDRPSPHRSSHSSSSMKHDNLPSPHSSSRGDSAEYSPRSRASMAIGSLLSSGPNHGDIPRGIHISEGRANDYIPHSTSLGPISV